VHVPLRCCQILMTGEILNRLCGRSPHVEMRTERMSKKVDSSFRQAALVKSLSEEILVGGPRHRMELPPGGQGAVSVRSGSSRSRLLPGGYDQEEENGCSTGWREV
jgi:hypothetical protein